MRITSLNKNILNASETFSYHQLTWLQNLKMLYQDYVKLSGIKESLQ